MISYKLKILASLLIILSALCYLRPTETSEHELVYAGILNNAPQSEISNAKEGIFPVVVVAGLVVTAMLTPTWTVKLDKSPTPSTRTGDSKTAMSLTKNVLYYKLN